MKPTQVPVQVRPTGRAGTAPPRRRNNRGRIAVAAGIGVVAIACGVAAAAPDDESPERAPTADAYEYRWAVAVPGGADLSSLNEAGKDGWDVVGPVTEAGGKRWTFLLRRPLS